MDVRPLHTERDYDWALAEVARYFETQPAPGSADGNRFEPGVPRALALRRDWNARLGLRARPRRLKNRDGGALAFPYRTLGEGGRWSEAKAVGWGEENSQME